MKHHWLVLLLAISLPLLAAEQPKPHPDMFGGAFFPPELVRLARDQIGLTPAQQQDFRARMEKAKARGDELRGKMELEAAALVGLAKQERVDEAALAAQLDKVIDLEREMRHVQLGLVAGIKNLLTPGQQAKLRAIAKDGGASLAEETRQRLTEKVERVSAAIQKWSENGRDPSEFVQAMADKFKPLMDAGKIVEAESELDRVLERLRQDSK